MSHINESDFRRLDLNLLLVFHALLHERSVTRAAQRLFIGQPALSGALKRLRAALGDDLFVRTSHGMTPTPRALELARVIEPLLLSLQQALHAKPAFDPAKAERVFRIGLSDALEVALMPRLMQRLSAEAPGVRLIARAADRTDAPALLDAAEIELAVGVFTECAAWHRQRSLFDWHFVCVYNPELVKVHGKRITLEEYLRFPHLLTSFSADLSGLVDELLREQGLARQVVFSSRNFATSPFIVRQMAAITTVPTFAAATWRDALGLAVSPLPFETPGYAVSLLWAAAHDGDLGLQWLVSLMGEVFSGKPVR
ncbi:LysR family transcriptional activator of mexEF-oprN operon [Variovorax boronicumulans]|uniref:LysR family transcriptional regulator n=1 Tax=Variovorax boronicumulans TaxID=436515 RepID=UPI002783B434|nr:LysR family transcriptional regulator [Variovorax boronicumulans]MDP9994341.1 LysR family transcriptional activator of mexEF-oprN operon [Variovorax boronicumulans]MDQ0005442.1 LysR family transcriptional activator of mexEF-oprN operon [Variovorax boronicumulans]